MRQPVILVAEDQPIVALDMCDTMQEAGYTVSGPFEDISSAMLAFQKDKPDLAILDVQLADGNVFPLAERMMAEDVPVIFHSGRCRPNEVDARFPGSQTLSKPCPPAEIIDSVQKALAAN